MDFPSLKRSSIVLLITVFSFHLLDKAKRNATTKWRRYESWSNQKKWSLLHQVFSIGTFTVAFMEALTVDRSYVRWLGSLKLPVSTWKDAASSGCHFLLPVVLCYPAKGKSRRRGLIKGEPPAQTLEILSRLQGADTNYVIVRVFDIRGIYGIYRKVLYYLKILRRIFTFIIHSKYFTVSDWLKSPG